MGVAATHRQLPSGAPKEALRSQGSQTPSLRFLNICIKERLTAQEKEARMGVIRGRLRGPGSGFGLSLGICIIEKQM